MRQLLDALKNTLLHPQWLSLRFHRISRRCLIELDNCTVLDIGSGDSDHARLLRPDCRLYRLDYPATNRRYRNAPDIYGDAASLPIAAETMDAVLLLEVLEHLPDDRKALSEIRRVLRPSGRLYLSVPFNYPVHDAPGDFRRYTVYGSRHLLATQGFAITRELCHGNSLVTAMQLFNLSLLEIARDLYLQSRTAGLFVGLLFYPLCLGVNLAAWPFTFVHGTRASCFGYFMTATRE